MNATLDGEPGGPLLVLAGPTAVGKSALALRLAASVPIEIISADSAAVYRGMDVGVAKATLAERAQVPHHGLDLVDPCQDFNVAAYQAYCRRVIRQVQERGRLPVLVGGSGLWLRAVVWPQAYRWLPADPALRAELEYDWQTKGPEAVFARLRSLDPDTAARIDPHNPRRVLRALEVVLLTGRAAPVGQAQDPSPSPYQVRYLVLDRPRADLYARINRRVEDQVAAGLCEEVRVLTAAYGSDCKAFQALGYKEMIAFLRGQARWAEAIDLLKRNTRRFAKRQWTWFRHERNVEWIDSTDTENLTRRLASVAAQLWFDSMKR